MAIKSFKSYSVDSYAFYARMISATTVIYSLLCQLNRLTGYFPVEESQWFGCIKPLTGWSLALLGAALFMQTSSDIKQRRWVKVLILIQLATLFIYFAGGLIIFKGRFPDGPSEMINCAAAFSSILMGVALLLSLGEDRIWKRIVIYTAIAAIFITSIIVINSRLFDPTEYGTLIVALYMKFDTSLLFLLLIAAWIYAFPLKTIEYFAQSVLAVKIIKNAGRVLILMPILAQFGLQQLIDAGLVSPSYALGLYVSTFVIVLTAGILITAMIVNKSENKYTQIFNDFNQFFLNSDDYLCIADFDGYFKLLSNSWTRNLGWSEEELKARPYIDFVHPEDIETTINACNELSIDHIVTSFRNRYRKRDGSYVDLEWTSRPNMEQEITYAVARDVTKQKELEDGLMQSTEEARIATQAKSEFLSNMSHELRTPLNSIIGFTEVLQDMLFGPLNDKQTQYLGYIENSSKHLLMLINDILDLSKVEAGKMELEIGLVSIRELLEASRLIVWEKSQKSGITLTTILEPEADISIAGDERKLKQILYNLLSNAVKFTPAGGTVTVTAALSSVPDETGKHPEYLKISMQDTGIGIAPEQIHLLFREFQQLESTYEKKYEGTGLGLALAKQLVELHGGTITVVSEPDIGSTFSVLLPRSINSAAMNSNAME